MELASVIEECCRGLVDRRPLVEAIFLAAVAGEHVLVIGPPGTAKSEAARRVAGALGGSYFEYLLSKFSEPSELFGPVDLRRLQEGVYETVVDGMLPQAEVAFLDEVFSGSTAILNTLLGILNERVYRRGSTRVQCPLRVCIGASNALPEEEHLAAFADRFLVRCFVQPVSDPMLEAMLEGGRRSVDGQARFELQRLEELSAAAEQVDLAPVRALLASALRKLRGQGVNLSDRRAVRVQRLIAAACAIDGRREAGPRDLWPLVLATPTAAGQEQARTCLQQELAESDNQALREVVEETSQGALARARRLAEAARSLLQGREANLQWELKVEGVLREIDACFAPADLPDELRLVRSELAATLP
jgi:MoxR-like ATPase